VASWDLALFLAESEKKTLPSQFSPDGEPAERLVGSDRVLALLAELANRPDGASLDELARALASPKSTVHRALAALTRARLATREGAGRYALGDEFLRLAFAYQDARPEATRILPALRALAARFGETAHYAVLDGADVVYRAKVDPLAGAARPTSTVGGRNPARATAVGKVLLSHLLTDDARAATWARLHPVEPRTPRTLTRDDAFVAEIARARDLGYAVDNQENEPGVNCLAVRVGGPHGEAAVSVSGLAYRTPLGVLEEAVEEIRAMVSASY
jgi:DNA-binding IclR family transcriptional regulator